MLRYFHFGALREEGRRAGWGRERERREAEEKEKGEKRRRREKGRRKGGMISNQTYLLTEYFQDVG